MLATNQTTLLTRIERERLAAALVERQRRKGQEGQPQGIAPTHAHLDLLTWTILRRPSLKPDGLFDLTRHPYLPGLYQDRSKVVVVYKASQMGASEWAVSYALHAADERGATVLYIFPTDTHVSDFSSARIGPAIEASAYLETIVIEGGGEGGKRGADRVTLKRVRDRFVYLRGAQVKPNGMAPQLKSVDADVIILDEVDEMDPRAPAIAEKRLGHSEIAEQRWISTPTYPGVGIHAKWLDSDQKEWHIRCEHCGERQPLTINQVVTEWDDLGRPVHWNGNEAEAFAACSKCGKALNRLGLGEWISMYPGRDIAGFHLTKLFSPTFELIQLVRGLQTTDETKRREAFNQDLGEPYLPHGGQLTDEILDDCRRDYGHKAVPHEATVMGADVGKIIHVVIRGPVDAETGERPQRWAGEVESFEEVGRLIKRFNVKRAVIDALPETRKARELQDDFAPKMNREGMQVPNYELGIIWLAYYVSQKTGTKNSECAVWNKDKGIVDIDRTRSLDTTFARFYDRENTLPGDAKAIPDYYDHLKASVRTVENDPTGQPVAAYIEKGPDHLAHAENYCMVASLDMPTAKRAGVWGRK